MYEGITSKEQKILNFYQNFINTNGYPPTYEEAGKKLKMTAPGVFFHVKKLKTKGYIDFGENTKYLAVATTSVKIPVIGKVACGMPIDVNEEIIDYIEIGKDMFKDLGEYYGLVAQGNSMIKAGINDGDYLIIKKQDDIDHNGQIAIVIDQEDDFNEKATLKRVYETLSSLMLQPANSEFPITFLNKCSIRGKLVKVIKNF